MAPRRPLAPEELDDFYRRYYRGLLRHVTLRCRISKEDAADIVQETFLLAMEKEWDPDMGSPRAWLVEVAERKAANFRRTRRRRADLLERWG
jgi:RNA polymerase sigma factor (sigma-70 family)